MDAERYVESLFPQDDILNMVMEGIRAEGMPEISVAPGYGRLLTLLVRLSGARRALEIGALGGYSGICIARGLGESGMLLSLEVNPLFAAAAERHVRLAGLAGKVAYRVGDARESIALLEEEGAKFDFFFIDADKGGYPHYLDAAIRMANPGALIVGDNILMKGRAADFAVESSSVKAMRVFSERIAADARLESVLLTGYDGLAIARVKESRD